MVLDSLLQLTLLQQGGWTTGSWDVPSDLSNTVILGCNVGWAATSVDASFLTLLPVFMKLVDIYYFETLICQICLKFFSDFKRWCMLEGKMEEINAWQIQKRFFVDVIPQNSSTEAENQLKFLWESKQKFFKFCSVRSCSVTVLGVRKKIQYWPLDSLAVVLILHVLEALRALISLLWLRSLSELFVYKYGCHDGLDVTLFFSLSIVFYCIIPFINKEQGKQKCLV